MCSCTGCCHVNQKELLKCWIFCAGLGLLKERGSMDEGKGQSMLIYFGLVEEFCCCFRDVDSIEHPLQSRCFRDKTILGFFQILIRLVVEFLLVRF